MKKNCSSPTDEFRNNEPQSIVNCTSKEALKEKLARKNKKIKTLNRIIRGKFFLNV